MIHLKFKNANTMAYSIVEIENKKYIMDLGSMKGKRYFLGLMPNLITLDMIELTPSDDSFEIKSKPKIGTTTISIMVQPFVALLYRAMESAFISMGLSQQIFMKSILFVLSMILAYLGAVYYEKNSRRNALSRIPEKSKRYRVKFKPNGKRNPVILFGFLLNIICFGFFIKKFFNDGEIELVRILTIVGCLVIMGIFIFMGFNWYKEDYYAIIYTFPYKVLMYFKETQISIEKTGIIKTLESRYFVYAMVVNMGFYLGTLKINNKNKRRNCVENQIDGDI